LRASRNESITCIGPMERTVTVPPWASRSRSPSSMAYRSKGLITEATPSRIKVLVSLLILTSVVSGTCLIQTIIFMAFLPTLPLLAARVLPACAILLLLAGVFFNQLQGDDIPLDLVGSFINLGNLGVPHHLLHRVFLHITVPAKDLDGVGGYPHRHI